MTITIRKLHLAIAVLAVVLIAPATAVATHVFSDVPDGAFYADPVEWAFDNEITTGKSPTQFAPLDSVTRGESVTFLNRYDTKIAQPALTDLGGDIATNTSGVAANASSVATNTSNIATNASGVATNAAGVAALDAAQPFAVTAFQSSGLLLTPPPTAYVTVTVTAPAAGHVTVNSTALVQHFQDLGQVRCVIVESTDIPPVNIVVSDESIQFFQTGGFVTVGSVSGTRTFAIAAGASIDYVLACQELNGDGGFIYTRNLTAIFTPRALTRHGWNRVEFANRGVDGHPEVYDHGHPDDRDLTSDLRYDIWQKTAEFLVDVFDLAAE